MSKNTIQTNLLWLIFTSSYDFISHDMLLWSLYIYIIWSCMGLREMNDESVRTLAGVVARWVIVARNKTPPIIELEPRISKTDWAPPNHLSIMQAMFSTHTRIGVVVVVVVRLLCHAPTGSQRPFPWMTVSFPRLSSPQKTRPNAPCCSRQSSNSHSWRRRLQR